MLPRKPLSNARGAWHVCTRSWPNKSWQVPLSLVNYISLIIILGFQNLMAPFNLYLGPPIPGYPPLMQLPQGGIVNVPNQMQSRSEATIPSNMNTVAGFQNARTRHIASRNVQIGSPIRYQYKGLR